MNIQELRLACLQIIVPTASRAGLTTGEIFEVAEKAFEFVTKATPEKPEGQAKAPKGK